VKKILSVILMVVVATLGLASVIQAEDSMVPPQNSTFDAITDVSKCDWFCFGTQAGTLALSKDGHTGNCVTMTGITQTWHSPALDVFPYFQAAGEGDYVIHLWVRSNGEMEDVITAKIRGGSEADQNSFILDAGSDLYFCSIGSSEDILLENEWTELFFTVPYIEEEDLEGTHQWIFCLDHMSPDTMNAISVDDFEIITLDEYENLTEEEPTETQPVDNDNLVTPVAAVTAAAVTATPVPTLVKTSAPVTTAPAVTEAPNEAGTDVVLIIMIAVAVLAIGGTVLLLIKNKKKNKS